MQASIKRAQKTYKLGTYANKEQQLFIQKGVKAKVPASGGNPTKDPATGRFLPRIQDKGKSREYWDQAIASALELTLVEAKNEFGDKFERKLPRVASKTSDIVGVYYDPRSDRGWNARIFFKNNQFYMGTYKSKEDAENAHATAKEVFFKDMKGNPSDEEIQERAALAKSKAYEVVIGNIHDEKTKWKCECGLIHSGERKRCLMYEGHSHADFLEGHSEGCGRWRGGKMPLERKGKKVEPINMSEEVTVIVPTRRKILTVLSSYGGNVGMTAEDIKNKIYEDYGEDEHIVESLIYAKLDTMVEENELVENSDVYSLPGSSETIEEVYKDILSSVASLVGEEKKTDVQVVKSADVALREARAKRRREGIPATAVKKKKKKVSKKVVEEKVPDPPLSEDVPAVYVGQLPLVINGAEENFDAYAV